MTSRTLTTCRSCGTGGLDEILDLGHQPLANRILTRDELDAPEPRFPLRLVFCLLLDFSQKLIVDRATVLVVDHWDAILLLQDTVLP